MSENYYSDFSADAETQRRERVKELVPGIGESDAQLLAQLGYFTQAYRLGDTALLTLDMVSRGKGHMYEISSSEAGHTLGPLGRVALRVAGRIYESGMAYRITANPNLPDISRGVVSVSPEARRAVIDDREFRKRTEVRNDDPQDHDLFQLAQNALLTRLAELAAIDIATVE